MLQMKEKKFTTENDATGQNEEGGRELESERKREQERDELQLVILKWHSELKGCFLKKREFRVRPRTHRNWLAKMPPMEKYANHLNEKRSRGIRLAKIIGVFQNLFYSPFSMAAFDNKLHAVRTQIPTDQTHFFLLT